MELFLVRHGQTDWNVLEKLQGKTDIELNNVGKQQAEITRKLIKNEKFDLIITSPLRRAKETACIINKELNIQIIEDKRLMERGFGELEGKNNDEMESIREKSPEVDEIWNYNKNSGIYNVEKLKDFCGRIYEFLDEIIEKYNDKKVLVVAHGGTSVIVKCYFMKYPLEKFTGRYEIKGLKNCEVARFEV